MGGRAGGSARAALRGAGVAVRSHLLAAPWRSRGGGEPRLRALAWEHRAAVPTGLGEQRALAVRAVGGNQRVAARSLSAALREADARGARPDHEAPWEPGSGFCRHAPPRLLPSPQRQLVAALHPRESRFVLQLPGLARPEFRVCRAKARLPLLHRRSTRPRGTGSAPHRREAKGSARPATPAGSE